MARFSIIIPAFNAAKTLAEALHSVEIQTFKDWELIVVNDGSTDDSEEVIANVTQGWDHVQLINQTNNGLGQARNLAARKAAGDWLVFLDADDYWAGNKLEQVNIHLQTYPECNVMYHAIFELSPNGMVRKRKFWAARNLDEFINLGNPYVPSAMAIKKDVFLKTGGFIEDRNQVEDLLFWFRLLRSGVRFCSLNKPLTVYRIGSGVTSNIEDHLQKVFEALATAESENLLTKDQVLVLKNRKYYEAARQMQKQKQFKEAAEFYDLCHFSGVKINLLKGLNKLNISL